MKKAILAALASVPILATTALGAHAATTNNQAKYEKCTVKLISGNGYSREYEISPIQPTKYWTTEIGVPIDYGLEAKLTLQGGQFTGNYKSELSRIPGTNQKVVITRVSPTEEGLMPLTPGMQNNGWAVGVESQQPHIFIQTSKYLSQQYMSMIMNPVVAQEKTTFVYPVVAGRFNHAFLKTLFNDLEAQTPENGYMASMTATVNSKKDTVFHFTYRDTPAQLAYVRKDVRKILAKVIKPEMDEYAKEFAIHNWIATHVKYDFTYNAAHNSDYSALTNHVAECQGISALTYQMMTVAGIPTRIVTGNVQNATYEFRGHHVSVVWGTKEPGEHAWDEVKLGGKWYQLDETVDLASDNNGRVSYNFFNLTDAQMKKSHSWSTALNWNGNGFFGGYPTANTDFVSVLQHSKNPQDEQILRAIEG